MEQKWLERMEAKLDDLHEHLVSIDKTLHGQHISLVDHIRRTALLEKSLEPIKSHVSKVQGAVKFLSVLAIVLGIYLKLKVLN